MNRKHKPYTAIYETALDRVHLLVKHESDAVGIRDAIGKCQLHRQVENQYGLGRDDRDFHRTPCRVSLKINDTLLTAWTKRRADAGLLHEMIGRGELEIIEVDHDDLAADIRNTETQHDRNEATTEEQGNERRPQTA